MSWKGKLVAAACRRKGFLTTAIVYGLGGRFFTREFYRAQGEIAARTPGTGGSISLSFDVDYPEDAESLPEVCEFLDQLGLKASFAVIGRLVEAYPDQHRVVVRAGHEIINHTYSHPANELLHPHEHFDELSAQDQKDQILQCHRVCQDLLGVSPPGFRAPHFGNIQGRLFYETLAGLGYRFSSSLSSAASPAFGLPFSTGHGIWEFPVSCCPRHPFAVLDTWHCFRKQKARHREEGQFSGLVGELIELASRYRGYLNLYLDPRDLVEFEEVRLALKVVASGRDKLRPLTYGSHLDMIQSCLRRWE